MNTWYRNTAILRTRLTDHLKATFASHLRGDSNGLWRVCIGRRTSLTSAFCMWGCMSKWFTTDAHRHMWKKFFINFSHFITKCMLQTTWITYLCFFFSLFCFLFVFQPLASRLQNFPTFREVSGNTDYWSQQVIILLFIFFSQALKKSPLV